MPKLRDLVSAHGLNELKNHKAIAQSIVERKRKTGIQGNKLVATATKR